MNSDSVIKKRGDRLKSADVNQARLRSLLSCIEDASRTHQNAFTCIFVRQFSRMHFRFFLNAHAFEASVPDPTDATSARPWVSAAKAVASTVKKKKKPSRARLTHFCYNTSLFPQGHGQKKAIAQPPMATLALYDLDHCQGQSHFVLLTKIKVKFEVKRTGVCGVFAFLKGKRVGRVHFQCVCGGGRWVQCKWPL